MRLVILFVAVLGFCGLAGAQVKQVARVEFELNEEGADRTDILGPYGLIVHGRINVKGRGDQWSIRRFNSDFALVDSIGFPVRENLVFAESWLTDDQSALYFLFNERGKRSFYKLLRFEAATGKMAVREAEIPRGTFFSKICVIGETIFLLGQFERKSAVFKYDFLSGKYEKLNFIPLHKYSTIEMDVPYGQSTLMLSEVVGLGKSYKHRVSFFDEKGNPSFQSQNVITEPDYYCRSSSLTVLNETEYILTGAYSQGKAATANGVYFARYNDNTQVTLKYHSFTGFKNFYEYLKPKQKEKAEKKVERGAKKGKEDFIEAFIASHPVFTFNDNYIYLGEIYFPTVRLEMRYGTGPNGTPAPSYVAVFDGYQYSHAVVLAMDKDGNKVYDHCFPMWMNYKPFEVKRFIRVVAGEGNVDMFFGNGPTIKCMRISETNLVERNLGEIEAVNENDKVRWTSMTQTSYWYDNFFISYGRQTIKNSEEKGKKKRSVFFVTKMQF